MDLISKAANACSVRYTAYYMLKCCSSLIFRNTRMCPTDFCFKTDELQYGTDHLPAFHSSKQRIN